VLFEDRPIESVPDLLAALEDLAVGDNRHWFRGHGDTSWRLLPKLSRIGKPEAEPLLIKRFKQDAPLLVDRIPSDDDDWEWLFLMQHHGVPTRLLDWTENPLVGLYFAVNAESHAHTDGCLWCLDPMGLNEAARYQPTFGADIPLIGSDEHLKLYSPQSVRGQSDTEVMPIAALGMRGFSRISAQAGVFTIGHYRPVPIEDVDGGAHVGRLVVPAQAKPAILKQLEVLGFSEKTLFPDLTSLAKHVAGLLE